MGEVAVYNCILSEDVHFADPKLEYLEGYEYPCVAEDHTIVDSVRCQL